MAKLPTTPPPPTLTDNEWRSAVAGYSGLGVWREDNVDDPEAGGVMKPQQKYNQQHRAEVFCGPHVSSKQLWCWTVLCLGVCVCAAGGGGRGGPVTNREVRPVETLYYHLVSARLLRPGQQSGMF